MDSIKFTRQQLLDLVWSEPMFHIAQKYDISDVGLRKLCNRVGVPVRKTGHWQRIKAGRKPTIPILPDGYNINEVISLSVRTVDPRKELSELEQIQAEIESDQRLNLVVPKRLSSPHPLIEIARISLEQNSESWRYHTISTRSEQLNMSMSKKNLSRSLRFMDTLLKAINARGHSVETRHRYTNFIVFKESIEVSFREKTKRVENKDSTESWRKYDYEPTGILSFQMGSYHRSEWKDGKLPIEEQLSRIIAKLELRGKQLMERTKEHNIARAKREEEERIRQELETRKQKEKDNFRELLNEANRWHQASLLRSYLKAAQSGQIPNKTGEWLEWAEKKLLWFDPASCLPDNLLTEADILRFRKYKTEPVQRTNPSIW